MGSKSGSPGWRPIRRRRDDVTRPELADAISVLVADALTSRDPDLADAGVILSLVGACLTAHREVDRSGLACLARTARVITDYRRIYPLSRAAI